MKKEDNVDLYKLLALDGPASNANTLYLPLNSSALTATTYTVGKAECYLNGKDYVKNSSDNFTAIISKIHDTVYADGTFYGQMTITSGGVSGTQKLIITNGEFKNVKILK